MSVKSLTRQSSDLSHRVRLSFCRHPPGRYSCQGHLGLQTLVRLASELLEHYAPARSPQLVCEAE
jgi:hypothetical protein